MPREIALFFFALAAVPLATFLWGIVWGCFARQGRRVMDGLRASWKRAMIATIVIVVCLLWLHHYDAKEERRTEEQHAELIKTLEQGFDNLIDIMEESNVGVR